MINAHETFAFRSLMTRRERRKSKKKKKKKKDCKMFMSKNSNFVKPNCRPPGGRKLKTENGINSD